MKKMDFACHSCCRKRLWAIVFGIVAASGMEMLSASPFSPQSGTVAPVERPFRDEVCLNGKWRFQPVPLPPGYKFEKGVVPDLPLPAPDKWESVPLKVPSPWNANSWGCGTDVGAGTKRPYDPDSLYYPSYPESWRHVRMGWLARTFSLDAPPRADQRLILHFESVAGECRVRVNGRDAGTHFDKYLPFDLDVTELVKAGENTLEVGIRDLKLFNRRESDYTKMVQPYPAGSNTDGLVGLWQDVSLVAEAAYRDYAGRNDALGVDVYSNYVCMAKGRLAYWSASETAWFGLEPLPLGYKDHTRLPGRSDGIPFADVPDGTWGPQVERMPPYVTTFNPGFDPALPLYRPLAMFLAHKAAMDPRGPQPCEWDHYPARPVRPAPPKDVKPGVNRLVFVSNAAELAEANRLAGGKLSLTDRTATQLVRASETDAAVASFTVDELYFAEAGEKDEQRRVALHGLDGTAGGEVLLRASNTDWSLFNRRAENAKVAAITCYEQLRKPAGAVLVAYPAGEGRIFVTTVERNPQTVRGRHFLRRLCANIGVPVPFGETAGQGGSAHEHDLLLDGPKD